MAHGLDRCDGFSLILNFIKKENQKNQKNPSNPCAINRNQILNFLIYFYKILFCKISVK